MKRHAFNMIEILLALGVIAVGVVSVLALFPAGLRSTRDAMAETYAANAAEQLLHSVRWNVEQDWDTWVLDTNWTTRPVASDLVIDSSVTGAGVFNSAGAIQQQTLRRVFKLVAFADVNDNQQFEGPPAEPADFECIAAVWGEQITLASGATVDAGVGTRINVEVSWPGQLPYASRNKRVYSLEVFNVQN